MASPHPSDRRAAPAAGVLAAVLLSQLVGPPMSLAAGSVDDYVGKRVGAVRLENDGVEIHDPALVALVETRSGRPLSMAQVRESILHLYSLGRFADIRVDATLWENGVVLRYLLTPVRPVGQIVLRGRLGLTEGRLRDVVRERYGSRLHPARAAEVERTLEELYHAHGYMSPRVTVSTVERPADRRLELVVDVDAGPRAQIGTVTVEGTPLLPRERLLARLGLVAGRSYERETLDRQLARYVAELHGKGYYEASADHEVALRGGGQLADIILTISAGPHVTVVMTGDPVPAERRDELVPVVREGSVDEDLLEDSSRRLTEYLHGQGYWKATVSHTRAERDNELEVVFTVRRGRQYRVGRVEIGGNASVPLSDLEPLLRLGTGALFVESTFAADVVAVTEHYRRLGYADVNVQPEVAETHQAADGQETGTALVALRITIVEGIRTVIRSVVLDGHHGLGEAYLRLVISCAPGQPFYRPQTAADRDAVVREYVNSGYQRASVDVEVGFSADRTAADLAFRIQEGPQTLVDHILIVGNTRTDSAIIARELTLKPGDPLGLDDLVESQRRLSALGLFRRIRIAELDHGGGNRRDIVVTVEEAPVTALGYGAGLEAGQRLRRATDAGRRAVERLEFAPRGFFEISRRNLWGKNRSINLFTRMSLRPRDEPGGPEQDGGGFGFSEYRVLGTYREPRVFRWYAEAVVTGFLEQAIRSSFNLNRQGVVAELRRRVAPSLSIGGRYSYNRNKLFDERFNPEDEPLVDRLFPEVKLSTFSTSLIRDSRDDPVDPTRGGLIEMDAEIAGRAFASEVGFAKTFLQGFAYRRLSGTRRVILAGGARLGLATAFPREVVREDDLGRPIIGPDGRPVTVVVREIPASERFFAGGDTTVRGFALDRLGDETTIDKDGFPKGGHALLVFNTEIRLPLWRDVGTVAFLDLGNVYARARHVDLTKLRGGAGFGIRYRSPIGPIRVDLGVKLDRRRFASGEKERAYALHISIGQAF